MKTLEEKRNEALPKYIKTKELEELMNSDEMKNLVRQLEINEEYKERTKYVSVGEY
jgi:hypothetical protein